MTVWLSSFCIAEPGKWSTCQGIRSTIITSCGRLTRTRFSHHRRRATFDTESGYIRWKALKLFAWPLGVYWGPFVQRRWFQARKCSDFPIKWFNTLPEADFSCLRMCQWKLNLGRSRSHPINFVQPRFCMGFKWRLRCLIIQFRNLLLRGKFVTLFRITVVSGWSGGWRACML
jgi:hypothetical protein